MLNILSYTHMKNWEMDGVTLSFLEHLIAAKDCFLLRLECQLLAETNVDWAKYGFEKVPL